MVFTSAITCSTSPHHSLFPHFAARPYVVRASEREPEVVAEREGLDELVHGGGAALGHPVVHQHKVIACAIECCCKDVICFGLQVFRFFRISLVAVFLVVSFQLSKFAKVFLNKLPMSTSILI